MIWTIIAAIAAAISAFGSAVAAVIMCRQNATKVRISVTNDLYTDKPQNVYNNERMGIAFVPTLISNQSSHPITISDCYIQIGKDKFFALEKGMTCDLEQSITLNATDHTSKSLTSEDFTRFPLELKPHQSMRVFILFPDFKKSNATIIKCKIKFNYGRIFPKTKTLIIHKLAAKA